MMFYTNVGIDMTREKVVYETADKIMVEVLIVDDSVWLNRKQLAALYERDVKTIGKHINNILKNKKYNSATIARFATVQQEGSRVVERQVEYYSLSIILDIGLKVNSNRSSQFRIWADEILKGYITQTKDDPDKYQSVNIITDKIHNVRGSIVMLDKDLAGFYNTDTRTLKQAVRRNIGRFPSDFMFELNDGDIKSMVSQSVIPSPKYFGGAKPFAFTEQGVSMLSAVIKTHIAVEVSVRIIRAFVEIKRLALSKSLIQNRVKQLEVKQIETDSKLIQLFNAIDDRSIIPNQGVFFDGQIFDAHKLVSDIVRKAKKQIVLIDNYIDDSVLTLLSKKDNNVRCAIYTKIVSKRLELDVEKFNLQYGKLDLYKFDKSHDRFLIIDSEVVYHIGASLKDLGRKWFAFSKMDKGSVESILNSINI